MAYDTYLAERIHQQLQEKKVPFSDTAASGLFENKNCFDPFFQPLFRSIQGIKNS